MCDGEEFAQSWHLLMKGSIIATAEGDVLAARRAKAMARRLLAETPRSTSDEPTGSGTRGIRWTPASLLRSGFTCVGAAGEVSER